MKHYKIYEHPAGRIEAVKQGWSWPAFFFVPTWALFKKMWGWAAAFSQRTSSPSSYSLKKKQEICH